MVVGERGNDGEDQRVVIKRELFIIDFFETFEMGVVGGGIQMVEQDKEKEKKDEVKKSVASW